jgi:hypothetical protein
VPVGACSAGFHLKPDGTCNPWQVDLGLPPLNVGAFASVALAPDGCVWLSQFNGVSYIGRLGPGGLSFEGGTFDTGSGGHALLFRDGYLYLVGAGFVRAQRDVFRAAVLEDCQLGPLEELPSLVQARWAPVAYVEGNQLVVIGGWDDSLSGQSTIEVADFLADGTLSEWSFAGAAPLPISGQVGRVVTETQVVLVGGRGHLAVDMPLRDIGTSLEVWTTIAASTAPGACGCEATECFCNQAGRRLMSQVVFANGALSERAVLEPGFFERDDGVVITTQNHVYYLGSRGPTGEADGVTYVADRDVLRRSVRGL